MKETCVVALSALEKFDSVSKTELKNSIFWEQQSDDMTKEYRQNQIARMQEGVCSGEGCIIYSEMLTDFERIGDHILNIAQELVA
jgi:phosphate:Na+ symporter